jgi:hypothetical protein
MARLRSLLRRRVQRLPRSLLPKLRRWLVGMAELCCRARRCGHVSRGVVSRAVSRHRARAAVVIVIAESVVDVDGIAGVDAMNRRGAGVSARTRRGPSTVLSRAGSIRQRL